MALVRLTVALVDPLESAAAAVPPQQLAFPSSVLVDLADIAAGHDPGSDAAAACLSVVTAVVCHPHAHAARKQVLRSKPALRCTVVSSTGVDLKHTSTLPLNRATHAAGGGPPSTLDGR